MAEESQTKTEQTIVEKVEQKPVTPEPRKQTVNKVRQTQKTKSATVFNSKKHGKSFHKKNGKDELDRRIVTIRRVSHTYKGGKRMSLSVLVVVGDRNGRVGAAIGKGADVKTAETKAYNKAKKNMVKITLNNTTIPHEIFHKKGAVKIFMKPAAPGTGVIAGASLRSVLELVGVKDILTKIIGAPNPITNVYATIEALQTFKHD